MISIIMVSIISWIILTLLRVAVQSLLVYGVKVKPSNGNWIYLIPQIILIIFYSYAVIMIFRSFDPNAFLILGIIWLVLVLIFEFIGSLVIQKKSLDELFEGWKIWRGNIWTLVLLSHLSVPYILKNITG
jgi:hypothetical protein